MDNDTFDLTPDFAKIRQVFSREARINADTILANLLPEHHVDPDYIKDVQLAVLRTFQSVMNRIDMVTQCTTNLEQLVELRELTHYVSEKIIAKANQIEDDLSPKLQQMPPPSFTFKTSDGYTLHWSEEHQIWFDADTWEERDLVFSARIDGWPMTDMDEEIEGDYIKENE